MEGQKYDVLWFNEKKGGWNRLTSANTLAESKEKAIKAIKDDEEKLHKNF